MIWLIKIVILLFLFIACILFHEWGHILFLRLYTKKWIPLQFNFKKLFPLNFEFVLSDPTEFDKLSPSQYQICIMGGVLFGIIPIVFYGYALQLWELIAIILMYFMGSYHDIKEIMESNEWGFEE